ncbi:MAG: hypothetical protein MZU84_04540 [Sphingobacterium sp.]|nr:hypothetical protein [Sphingobacterium sp.]
MMTRPHRRPGDRDAGRLRLPLPSFLRFIPLAPGTLAGTAPWCELEIRAADPGGATTGHRRHRSVRPAGSRRADTGLRRGVAGA